MNVEQTIRLMAGLLMMGFSFLSQYHAVAWTWGVIFIGFMLAQSTVTGICPMAMVLKKLGVKEN